MNCRPNMSHPDFFLGHFTSWKHQNSVRPKHGKAGGGEEGLELPFSSSASVHTHLQMPAFVGSSSYYLHTVGCAVAVLSSAPSAALLMLAIGAGARYGKSWRLELCLSCFKKQLLTPILQL